MKGAARVGMDKVVQKSPHCHAPIHPAAPVPTPVPHPALPLTITGPGVATVMIDHAPAAVMGDMTAPCMLPSCVPAGPGMITMTSMTVKFAMRGAARDGDMTAHISCVAPIPCPTGEVMSPCSVTVKIGG